MRFNSAVELSKVLMNLKDKSIANATHINRKMNEEKLKGTQENM